MLAVKPRAVEIEVHSANGNQLFFSPIGKALRGHVEFSRYKSKCSSSAGDYWKDPIPGMVIGIDASGAKYVREPLHDKDQFANRQRIAKRGFELPPEREAYESESLLTWLYHMRRAVDAGLARVLNGELPVIEELDPPTTRKLADPGKPRKNFMFAEPEESSNDRLAKVFQGMTESLAANTAVMQKLLEKLK